jgi:hypothetical protein
LKRNYLLTIIIGRMSSEEVGKHKNISTKTDTNEEKGLKKMNCMSEMIRHRCLCGKGS